MAADRLPLFINVTVCSHWSCNSEIFGTSAISAFARHDSSALEGLLTARFETVDKWEPTLRVKLGGGGGLHPFFGAPEWRAIIGVELSGNR